MSDLENSRAQAEALHETGTRALRSARRAQLWAGLNRYLASESAHARKVAVSEKPEVPEQRATSRKTGNAVEPDEATDETAGETDEQSEEEQEELDERDPG